MVGSRESKATAWEPLFSLLVGDPRVQFPYPIDADSSPNTVTVSVPVDKIAEFKKQMSQLFIQGLPSSVRVRQSASHDEIKESKRGGAPLSSPTIYLMQTNRPDENKLKEGLRIFKSVFGQRQKIAGATYMDSDDLFDEKSGAEAKNGVLMSIPLDPDANVKPYRDIVANLAARFKDSTAERVREAFCSDDKPLPQGKRVDSNDPIPFEVALFAQCIDVVTGPNTEQRIESRIYFNYNLLWKLLSPPALVQLSYSDEKAQTARFSFDKEHLLSYLQALAKSPVILSQTKGIFVASQKGLADKDNLIYFVCDISGSMWQNVPGTPDTIPLPIDIFKKEMIAFLKLFKNSPAAARTQARFIFYSTMTGNTHLFSSLSDIEPIIKLIDEQSEGGCTRASGTLAEVLETIERQGATISHNVFIVSIGDGQDNNGELTTASREVRTRAERAIAYNRNKIHGCSQRLIELESKNPKATRPQVITLACGLQHDADFHRKLAADTAGKFHNEKDIGSALASLAENAESMQWARRVLKVVERLEEESKNASRPAPENVRNIPVYLNGEPQVFTIDNPFGESSTVYINGERYSSTPAPVAQLGLSSLPSAAPGSLPSVITALQQLSLSSMPSAAPMPLPINVLPSAATVRAQPSTLAPVTQLGLSDMPSAAPVRLPIDVPPSGAIVPPQQPSATESRWNASARALAGQARSALSAVRGLAQGAAMRSEPEQDDDHDGPDVRERSCIIM